MFACITVSFNVAAILVARKKSKKQNIPFLKPGFCSLGDGVEFPVQSRHHLSSYQSMDRTQTRSA